MVATAVLLMAVGRSPAMIYVGAPNSRAITYLLEPTLLPGHPGTTVFITPTELGRE